jgi:hypothetical protein
VICSRYPVQPDLLLACHKHRSPSPRRFLPRRVNSVA